MANEYLLFFCYNELIVTSPGDKSSLESVFASIPNRQELGHMRKVWGVFVKPEGKMGIDYIVKDNLSRDEVEVLKFLDGLDISEVLLTYDETKLVFDKNRGEHMNDYVGKLIRANAKKQKIITPGIESPNSRFRILKSEKTYLPREVLLEDKEVMQFCADYISKIIFLFVNGVFHHDIKTDNIYIESDGTVRFIDFGEAIIAQENYLGSTARRLFYDDLSKAIELIQNLYPDFGDLAKKLAADAKGKTDLPPFIKYLYKQYQDKNIPLSQRPGMLQIEFNSRSGSKEYGSSLAVNLASLGLPKELAVEVERRVIDLTKKATRE